MFYFLFSERRSPSKTRQYDSRDNALRRKRHFVRVRRRRVLPDVADRHDVGDARRLQIALILRSGFRRHLRTAGQQQTGSSGRIRPGAVRTVFQFPEIHLSEEGEKH